MSFPTPRLACARRVAAAALVLALGLTPLTALAAPIGLDSGPRAGVIAALDLLGAWWRWIADVLDGDNRSGSDGEVRELRGVAEKCGPTLDPAGGR